MVGIDLGLNPGLLVNTLPTGPIYKCKYKEQCKNIGVNTTVHMLLATWSFGGESMYFYGLMSWQMPMFKIKISKHQHMYLVWWIIMIHPHIQTSLSHTHTHIYIYIYILVQWRRELKMAEMNTQHKIWIFIELFLLRSTFASLVQGYLKALNHLRFSSLVCFYKFVIILSYQIILVSPWFSTFNSGQSDTKPAPRVP